MVAQRRQLVWDEPPAALNLPDLFGLLKANGSARSIGSVPPPLRYGCT